MKFGISFRITARRPAFGPRWANGMCPNRAGDDVVSHSVRPPLNSRACRRPCADQNGRADRSCCSDRHPFQRGNDIGWRRFRASAGPILSLETKRSDTTRAPSGRSRFRQILDDSSHCPSTRFGDVFLVASARSRVREDVAEFGATRPTAIGPGLVRQLAPFATAVRRFFAARYAPATGGLRCSGLA